MKKLIFGSVLIMAGAIIIAGSLIGGGAWASGNLYADIQDSVTWRRFLIVGSIVSIIGFIIAVKDISSTPKEESEQTVE